MYLFIAMLNRQAILSSWSIVLKFRIHTNFIRQGNSLKIHAPIQERTLQFSQPQKGLISGMAILKEKDLRRTAHHRLTQPCVRIKRTAICKKKVIFVFYSILKAVCFFSLWEILSLCSWSLLLKFGAAHLVLIF